jgi:hypothetical protein
MDSLSTRAHRTVRDLIPWSLRMDIKQGAKRILRRTYETEHKLHIRALRALCFLTFRYL